MAGSGCPICWRVLSSISGQYSLDAPCILQVVTTKNVSRHGHISPGARQHNHYLKSTALHQSDHSCPWLNPLVPPPPPMAYRMRPNWCHLSYISSCFLPRVMFLPSSHVHLALWLPWPLYHMLNVSWSFVPLKLCKCHLFFPRCPTPAHLARLSLRVTSLEKPFFPQPRQAQWLSCVALSHMCLTVEYDCSWFEPPSE